MAYTTEAKVRKKALIIKADYMDDPDVLNEHIGDVDAIIDSALASKYTVPFSPTPKIIEVIATKMAACSVLRTSYTQSGRNENKQTTAICKEADKLLEEVAEGKKAIIGDEGVIETSDGSPYSTTEKYKPTFDMGDVIDQEVDPDLLKDIDNARK